MAAVPAPARCWSCRVLSGSALLGSALWVYKGARSQRAAPGSLGTVMQLVFSAGLAALGIVVIAVPVKKQNPNPPES